MFRVSIKVVLSNSDTSDDVTVIGNFLVVPKFYPSTLMSIKQLGYHFAFDAPTVWKAFPDGIRASPPIVTFRQQLKTFLYTKAYRP